jgi:hypothetical protein
MSDRVHTVPVVALVAVCIAATACQPKPEDVANGDDPIAALRVAVRSTRYDGPYWQQQRLAASDVWKRALAECTPEQATQRPNCEPVVANQRAGQGNARADSVLRAAGQAVQRGAR